MVEKAPKYPGAVQRKIKNESMAAAYPLVKTKRLLKTGCFICSAVFQSIFENEYSYKRLRQHLSVLHVLSVL